MKSKLHLYRDSVEVEKPSTAILTTYGRCVPLRSVTPSLGSCLGIDVTQFKRYTRAQINSSDQWQQNSWDQWDTGSSQPNAQSQNAI